MYISLNDLGKIKKFISISQNVRGEVTLKSGKYVVDGKSILGIYSLDLSQPITLVTEDLDSFKEFEVIKGE